MASSSPLRRYFWIAPLALVANAAYCNAQAVSELIGATLTPGASDYARAPAYRANPPPAESTARGASAETILARNPFDHVTGPLNAPPSTALGDAETASGPADTSDPWNAAPCEGVNVSAIAASQDEAWSFASFAGSDGKRKLARRGDDVGGKTVYFIGWDRVWLTTAGSLCQASLFAKAKPPPAPAPAPPPSAAPSSTAPRRGAPALSADLKQGIQKVSATEYNIDRGVLDKILENQAELMRQARVVPVQQNGKVVGVKLNGIKPDALLGVLGMENGDTLKTINGFDMGSPQKALEAYARLRTADKLTMQVDRGGKNMNLDYNIK